MRNAAAPRLETLLPRARHVARDRRHHHRDRPRRRRLAGIALLLVVVLAAAAIVINDTVVSGDGDDPERQRILDALVDGPTAVAPGATAYVSGPTAAWVGAAGVADIAADAPMPPDARMRLESVSKLYVSAVVFQLEQEGVLDTGDTVDQWVPGLLPHGGDITIEQLLANTSGLIDDNDIQDAFRAGTFDRYLDNVEDEQLIARVDDAVERLLDDPTAEVSPMLFIELAAWQPLLFTPGTDARHSNIGFNIVGLIAERATGQDLSTLYRQRIFEPLNLEHTAYDPQGPITGPHAKGYEVVGGEATDATATHYGKGADGGIVADAADVGTFLRSLMNGDLLDADHIAQMQQRLFGDGMDGGCGDAAYDAIGTGDAYRTYVNVNADGSRVTVLLLNGRIVPGDVTDAAADASRALYCGT
jgi:D-alanyl-D-alanine carboxypeptidase